MDVYPTLAGYLAAFWNYWLLTIYYSVLVYVHFSMSIRFVMDVFQLIWKEQIYLIDVDTHRLKVSHIIYMNWWQSRVLESVDFNSMSAGPRHKGLEGTRYLFVQWKRGSIQQP